MTPDSETALADIISSAKNPLRIIGGGTRPIGHTDGATLSTAGLTGVTLYEPGALTLVAGAGTTVAEVEALLDTEGQQLAFEPMDHRPLLGTTGTPTLGGVVAANVSGPRRITVGACRDFMLGARFVDGSGNIVKNGGRVMKNVTGYDLVKLLSGSYGTLGVMTEVSLKVLPRTAETTVVLQGPQGLKALEAMTKMTNSPFEPTGAAHLPKQAQTLFRFEGVGDSPAYRAGEAKALLAAFGSISILDDPVASRQHWADIRDVTAFRDATAVWRISMAPSAMTNGLLAAATQVCDFDYQLDWAGGLCWLAVSEKQALQNAATLQAAEQTATAGITAMHHSLQDMVAREGGGHATLVKAPLEHRKALRVFQPEPAPLGAISAGLRSKFDPRGILNPGLMG